MPHPGEDDLALVALGESLPDVLEHVRDCAACSDELAALAATVDTARGADTTQLPAPPPAVWQRIAGELGLADHDPVHDPVHDAEHHSERDPVTAPVAAPVAVLARPLERSPRRAIRRPLLLGAAALAAAAAAVAAVAVSGLGLPGGTERQTVPLVALGTVDASGEVVLSGSDDSRRLLVDTAGLPRPDGFYEVWLLDVEHERVVALGALDDRGRGRLTVPAGVRVDDYPQVDVSREPDDGDPAHSGQSVLRGDLRS